MRLSQALPTIAILAALAKADNGVPNINAPLSLVSGRGFSFKGRVFDFCIRANSNTNGAPVTISGCNTTDDNQRWTFAGGSVKVFGNKCLDVQDGSTQDGTHLQIWDCVEGNKNQQFFYTGDNRLAWTDHGKCADLTNGSLNFGNRIQVWQCGDGNLNQLWNVRSDKGSALPTSGPIRVLPRPPAPTTSVPATSAPIPSVPTTTATSTVSTTIA